MTIPFYTVANKPSPAGEDQARDPRARVLDDLQRKSEEHRDEVLGTEWFKEIKDFFNLEESKTPTPSFRPKVMVPQLQVLVLYEATDLSDCDPRLYIVNKDGTRDKAHESALMAQWRQGFYSNKIMHAIVWSLLCGVGFLQVGFDPAARNGQGSVWLEAVDPSQIYPDPEASDDQDWAYVIREKPMYLDEVRNRWPEQGWKVRSKASIKATALGESHNKFAPPEGPMTIMPGMANEAAPVIGDNRVKVRYAWLRDATIEPAPQHEVPNVAGVDIPMRSKYPNGRYIIECEGVVLFDDENPTPNGMFPIVRIPSMPSIGGIYVVPPTRYTKSLQELAQRMMTQTFENATRLNNGIVLIDESSGINLDNFGGIPAEVHVVSQQSAGRAVQIITPPAFPQHMVEMPKMLLELQRHLQGFTPVRSGEPGQGNISPGLYDMSVQQSQKLTRMRGRLLAEAIQKLAELVFYTMAKFYNGSRIFPELRGDDFVQNNWDDISCQWDQFNIYLDPNSIRPVTGAALRMMALPLFQGGLIDRETALEMLEVPGAKEVNQKVQQQQQLMGLANVMQPGKKR